MFCSRRFVRSRPHSETIQTEASKATLDRNQQDLLYAQASSTHAAAIRRLARGYEADPDKQLDLLQEIHLDLWKSFEYFDRRCSLRTWVYRIAHNVGASHVVRSRRLAARLVDLETVDDEISAVDTQEHVDRRFSAAILLDLVRRLRPLDRQIILLYLEGESGGAIAEVTGLSATHVATKIHRIKRMLKQSYSTLLLRSHASPWLFVGTIAALILAWFAFGKAAEKAARDREEVRQAIGS